MKNRRSRRNSEGLLSGKTPPALSVVTSTAVQPNISRRMDHRTGNALRATRGRAGVIHPPHRHLPHPSHLAFYVGLAVITIFEVIEWPVALVIGLGHEIAHRTHRRAVRELVEGIESGV